VHARAQLASFRTESEIAADAFYRGLNALLPHDVRVLHCQDTTLEFDPRRDNGGKHYRYSIYCGRILPPDVERFFFHRHGPLDLRLMAENAAKLVGRHDFAAFRAADCERVTTVRTIYRCTISTRGPSVVIDVEGTAFLKNMVRIIAGTLIDIGCGKLEPTIISGLLKGGDRRQSGITAPAKGLCLMRVFSRDLSR
jgi:tRNA pseudouridine38-40 synthase